MCVEYDAREDVPSKSNSVSVGVSLLVLLGPHDFAQTSCPVASEAGLNAWGRCKGSIQSPLTLLATVLSLAFWRDGPRKARET